MKVQVSPCCLEAATEGSHLPSACAMPCEGSSCGASGASGPALLTAFCMFGSVA